MSTACALALAALIQNVQPKLGPPVREWVAVNVCNAARDTATDPLLLAAYMLTENRAIDLWAVVPAACGNDHSLFQINSCYQKTRPHFDQIHHPYYGARIAATILQENVRSFGWTWQAFAAYWNPQQARAGTAQALAYYVRYHANAQHAARFFAPVVQETSAARAGVTAWTASATSTMSIGTSASAALPHTAFSTRQ